MVQETEIWDVVIAGAGPAGSVLACSLLSAHPAAKVCLLDREQFPRDKACGDGIGPGVVRVLEELGLTGVWQGYQPVDYFRLRSPSGRELAGELPSINGGDPIGYVIPRLVFDNRLFESAIRLGAADFTGQAIVSAAFDEGADNWEIVAKGQGIGESGNPGIRVLRARILVGADGARSTVRRILGIPYNPPSHTAIAIRRYVEVRSGGGPRALELDFLREVLPGYGWLFRISEQRANVGVGCDVSVYRRRKLELTAMLEKYCALLEKDHRLVLDRASDRSFILPLGSQLPPLASGPAALIGDAASMINPMTGEGLQYGTYAGKLLGSLLAAALNQGTDPSAALVEYERSFRVKFQRHFQANHKVKRFATSPFWFDVGMRAGARDPRIVRGAVHVMMGEGDDFGLGRAVRVLFRGMRRTSV